jgi:hypothetical protein
MIVDLNSLDHSNLKSFSVAWLFPSMNIVADPAFRLRRYMIHQYLKRLHYLVKESRIIVGGAVHEEGTGYHINDTDNFIKYLKRFDAVVLFDLEEEDGIIVEELANSNTLCIFDHSESLFGLPHEDKIMKNAAAISCCSTVLMHYTNNHTIQIGAPDVPIFLIYDPIDIGTEYRKLPVYKSSNRACLLGANVQPYSDFLLGICEKAGYNFTVINKANFDKRFECLEYTPYSWIEDITNCDIVLCYHDINRYPCKSNVKASTAMGLGMPVLACPLHSYKEAITHGFNGFIADNEDEWVRYLSELRDPKLRQFIGMNAKVSAFYQYGIHSVGSTFISMIQSLLKDKR